MKICLECQNNENGICIKTGKPVDDREDCRQFYSQEDWRVDVNFKPYRRKINQEGV